MHKTGHGTALHSNFLSILVSNIFWLMIDSFPLIMAVSMFFKDVSIAKKPGYKNMFPTVESRTTTCIYLITYNQIFVNQTNITCINALRWSLMISQFLNVTLRSQLISTVLTLHFKSNQIHWYWHSWLLRRPIKTVYK